MIGIRPGRTKALIQRKRRKAHVASIAPGEQAWLTACDRTIPVQDTPFALLAEAVDQIDDADVCKACAALYATADEFYDRGYTAGYEAALKEMTR
jgi:hypothetical protein